MITFCSDSHYPSSSSSHFQLKMSETKIVIGIASLCSIAAILATLVVVPQLYQQMNEVNTRVFDTVQVSELDGVEIRDWNSKFTPLN